MARQHPVGPGLPHPRSSWRGPAIAAIALPVLALVVVAANVTPGLAFMAALVGGMAELWFVRRRPAPAGVAVLPARQTWLRRLLLPVPEPEPWDPDAELRELTRRDGGVPPGA